MATKKVELNQLVGKTPDTYDILVPNCILNADGTTSGLTQNSDILSVNNNANRTIPQEEIWFDSIPLTSSEEGTTVQLTDYGKTIEKNKQYFFYIDGNPRFTVFTKTTGDAFKTRLNWSSSASSDNVANMITFTTLVEFNFVDNTIYFEPIKAVGIKLNKSTQQLTEVFDYRMPGTVYNFGVLLV